MLARLPSDIQIWRYPGMVALMGYTLVAFTGFFATLSALPAYLARTGSSESVAGSVTAVLLSTTVVTQLAVPALVERFGMRAVLQLSVLLLGAPTLLLLLSDDLATMMTVSVFRGAGFGGATVIGATLTARIVPVARRGEAIGAYGLSIAIPNLLALPGGVALVSAGWYPAMVALGAMPILGLAFVHRLDASTQEPAASNLGDPQPQKSETSRAAQTSGVAPAATSVVMSRRASIVAALPPSLVLAVVTLAGGAFITFVPIQRPDGAVATSALLLWGLTGAITRWQVGPWADRHGLMRLLPSGLLLAIIGLLVAVAGLAYPNPWWSDGAIIAGGAILGVGFGAIQNLTLVAAFMRSRYQHTTSVSSIWNAGFDTGTALGAGLVGAMLVLMTIPQALLITAVAVLAVLPVGIHSSRPPADRT